MVKKEPEKKSSDFKTYKKEIMDAAHNDRLRLALSRAVKSFRGNVKNALEKFPHTVAMADEVLKIKEKLLVSAVSYADGNAEDYLTEYKLYKENSL